MASLRPAARLVPRRLVQITAPRASLASNTRHHVHPFVPASTIHTTRVLFQDDSSSNPSSSFSASPPSAEVPSSKIYTFEEIQSLSSSLPPNDDDAGKRILFDVREPGELKSTGQIPGALNVPVSSAPDSFFLSEEDFEDRYGFPRPSSEDEVVFYCKAGVRSKAAARLASQAGFGGKIGEFPGSWIEWVEKGGKIERA